MTSTTQASAARIDLVRLTKRFGSFTAVDDLSLEIPAGSFFALLGPSGCGKTTTLRMIGGLEEPTSGQVLLGGEDVTDRKPYRRPVNTVFQSYALFPHLTIFENVAFGLRRTKAKEIRSQVEQMLELVELSGYGDRRPNALSGGQQQRVALARALINHPKVLLLDEPLGALDLKLRRQMQLELKRIQTEVGITFVHVTHDQEEAMTMADTIAVMHAGRVEQLGGPAELYARPATAFVANFLGQSNLLDGRVVERSGERLHVDVRGVPVVAVGGDQAVGDRVRVGVRPEKITITAEESTPDPPGENALRGVVADTSFTGVSTQYEVELGWGQKVTVFAQNLGLDAGLAPGSPVTLAWRGEHTFCVAPEAGPVPEESDGVAPDVPDTPTPGDVASTVADAPEVTRSS